MFPLISTLVLGRKMSLDQVFYNQVTIPIWLSLVVLMGICPVLNWKKTEGVRFRNRLLWPGVVGMGTAVALYLAGLHQGMAVLSFGIAAFVVAAIGQDFLLGVWEDRRASGRNLLTASLRFFAKRRQRYGAYTIHIGVIVILVGITGSIYQQEVTQTMKPGDVLNLHTYRLEYSGLEPRTEKGYSHVTATLKVYEGEAVRGTVRSEKVFHARYRQPATEVGILSSLRDDLYFNLAGWDGDVAHVQVSLHPLTSWIWIGSYLLYLGVLIILWPRKRQTAIA
jgi:cytochrome c-type biogenesis protein CcmF